MIRQLNLATGRYESVETAEEVRRRTEPRKRFSTKAEWAQDKADSISREIQQMRYASSNGRLHAARDKYRAISYMQAEANKYYRMATLYRQKGL